MKSYKGVTFKGSTFPDDPYRHIKVVIDEPVIKEYIPAFDKAFPGATKGLKLLLTSMTDSEGFYPATATRDASRSYRTKNPGNIGNMDNGSNRRLLTLEDGIKLQVSFIQGIAAGTSHHYPMNVFIDIEPFWSAEVEKNKVKYGRPDGYYPGYEFTFTGQLDQFVKIYSVGARATNSYINQMVSYFADNGLTITPESKIQDIIKMN